MTAAFTGTEICVFDAYGTLFDFNSAVARHRGAIGAKADALADLWRAKQIQYTWLRNGMGAYAPFWQVTGEALDHCLAAHDISAPDARDKLMSAYLALDPFPEVPAMLDALQRAGLRLAILSNGNPEMLDPMVAASGLAARFEAVLSVDSVGVASHFRRCPSRCPPPGRRHLAHAAARECPRQRSARRTAVHQGRVPAAHRLVQAARRL